MSTNESPRVENTNCFTDMGDPMPTIESPGDCFTDMGDPMSTIESQLLPANSQREKIPCRDRIPITSLTWEIRRGGSSKTNLHVA